MPGERRRHPNHYRSAPSRSLPDARGAIVRVQALPHRLKRHQKSDTLLANTKNSGILGTQDDGHFAFLLAERWRCAMSLHRRAVLNASVSRFVESLRHPSFESDRVCSAFSY